MTFDAVKLGWSIIYIEVSHVMISKNIEVLYFFLKRLSFVLANGTDPKMMPHYVAFNIGLYFLSNYPFFGITVLKGLNDTISI